MNAEQDTTRRVTTVTYPTEQSVLLTHTDSDYSVAIVETPRGYPFVLYLSQPTIPSEVSQQRLHPSATDALVGMLICANKENATQAATKQIEIWVKENGKNQAQLPENMSHEEVDINVPLEPIMWMLQSYSV